MEGEVGGAKHLSRSEAGSRALFKFPAVDLTTLVGSAARVMQMVGLARVVEVAFKMEGWVEFHMVDG